MSRTIRRKNYEAENRTSWDNRGGKIAGFYTEKVLHYVNGGVWYTFREPTYQEYHKRYRNIHGENNNYYHSTPSKWYRYSTIHQYRMQDKKELRKFMQNEDYEPMCRNRISSGYWD